MEVVESGRTNVITGHWDPTIQDLLVLNTETPKGQLTTLHCLQLHFSWFFGLRDVGVFSRRGTRIVNLSICRTWSPT